MGTPYHHPFSLAVAQSCDACDNSTVFWKDGYTDMRGRFDYASLSTRSVATVDKFSVLIMSDDGGAVVREASPPKL